MTPPVSSASVSSDNSPYEVIIELSEVIYNPGDVVAGQITLNLKRKLCCEMLTVRLYGSARVFFTEKIVGSFPTLPHSSRFQTKPGALSTTKAYEQEQVLVDEKKEVWACPKTSQAPKEISVSALPWSSATLCLAG